MRYIFPPTKFVRENSVEEQLLHILSEVSELIDEITIKHINDYHYEVIGHTTKMLGEAIDLHHSLETLFRKLEDMGVDVEGGFQGTLDKNRARGYYMGEKKTEGIK